MHSEYSNGVPTSHHIPALTDLNYNEVEEEIKKIDIARMKEGKAEGERKVPSTFSEVIKDP